MNAWYMSGAGNDFMVIDARGLALDFTALAKELCTKKGCDGFMAVDYSDKAHFKLHFYNADGSRGEMCGNGSLKWEDVWDPLQNNPLGWCGRYR